MEMFNSFDRALGPSVAYWKNVPFCGTTQPQHFWMPKGEQKRRTLGNWWSGLEADRGFLTNAGVSRSIDPYKYSRSWISIHSCRLEKRGKDHLSMLEKTMGIAWDCIVRYSQLHALKNIIKYPNDSRFSLAKTLQSSNAASRAWCDAWLLHSTPWERMWLLNVHITIFQVVQIRFRRKSPTLLDLQIPIFFEVQLTTTLFGSFFGPDLARSRRCVRSCCCWRHFTVHACGKLDLAQGLVLGCSWHTNTCAYQSISYRCQGYWLLWRTQRGKQH